MGSRSRRVILEMPPYVYETRPGCWYFAPPPRYHIDGWAKTYRLPTVEADRELTGNAMTIAVARDGFALYERWNAERTGTKQRVPADSLLGLIKSFSQSDRFKDLKPSSARQYLTNERKVRAFAEALHNPPVSSVGRPKLLALLDQLADRPFARHHLKAYLVVLFEHARDLGLIEVSPIAKTRYRLPVSKVIIWEQAQIEERVAVCDAAGWPSIGTAILIAAETGQRPGDVLKLRRGEHYTDGMFRFFQEKTGAEVVFPATQRLRERIDGQKATLLVPHPKTGRWHQRVFQARYTKIMEDAKLDVLLIRWLRHSACVSLARAGCTIPQIASITGHSVASVHVIMRHYLPRDSVVATEAIAKLEEFRKQKENKS